MNIAPAVVLVLAAIGFVRIVRVLLGATRNTLRALGRKLAALGDRKPANQAPDPTVFTQADLDTFVAAAVGRLLP